MTTCLGMSCSFGLLCAFFMGVVKFCVCPFPLGIEGRLWDVIVLIPDHLTSKCDVNTNLLFQIFRKSRIQQPHYSFVSCQRWGNICEKRFQDNYRTPRQPVYHIFWVVTL